MVTAVVIGGLFLLGMIVEAAYAIRVLPAGARVPLNAGVPEYSAWLPRWAGLGAWLGIGVAVYAALGSLTASAIAGNWVSSMREMLLPCAMLVVLAAETGAVITARQQAGRELVSVPDAEYAAEAISVPPSVPVTDAASAAGEAAAGEAAAGEAAAGDAGS